MTGKLGSGRQCMSWISLADEIAAIRFALQNETVRDAVNLTAPHPATNATFTKALGAALHRPTFLTIPRFVRRAPAPVGGLIDSLLFSSARVAPSALLAAGFTFDHPHLPDALQAVLGS